MNSRSGKQRRRTHRLFMNFVQEHRLDPLFVRWMLDMELLEILNAKKNAQSLRLKPEFTLEEAKLAYSAHLRIEAANVSEHVHRWGNWLKEDFGDVIPDGLFKRT